ncbi:hypothetical protein QUB19_18315 [Microcoleus sp. B4-C5]|uniref:hypothetical protein n=1 Tax=unclassified Microcoleus TaxID=2642155 RepID=UPI002FD10CD6
MPVPQRVNFLVEQAEKPVLENGARCEVARHSRRHRVLIPGRPTPIGNNDPAVG